MTVSKTPEALKTLPHGAKAVAVGHLPGNIPLVE